jgi:hypothetical protein
MMCDRAGIGAVWAADELPDLGEAWSRDGWGLARELRRLVARSSVGAFVDPRRRPPSELASDIERDGEAEIAVLGPAEVSAAYVVAVRARFAATGSQTSRVRLSAIAAGMADFGTLLGVVDEVVLPGWRFDDLEGAADELRAEALEQGRRSAGIAALVPVSIGRTGAEAAARADGDLVFGRTGHPAKTGIFGTLEECQDRVIALAHAGVTDLRCILPSTPDVHDVIAQLTAMVVGTIDVLQPGSLRSPAPPPPEGWGGRPERPPAPRVSGDSRQR